MARVLVTGMSGTGKSSVLAVLAERGLRVVDLDDPGWSVEVAAADGDQEQLWVEDQVSALLAHATAEPLVIAGCASNQGRFYDRFDAVVLLSVPEDVLLERLAKRTTNPFGKDAADLRRILGDLQTVEPALRATSTVEIVTTQPLSDVADAVEALARARGADQ